LKERRRAERHSLTFEIARQPDATTCGPTCLHALYRFWGDDTVALDDVIREVPTLDSGGTLGALLGTHALGRGFRVSLYTFNLSLFDPTWFSFDRDRLIERLTAQADAKREPRLRVATRAYLDLLSNGGEVRFADLSWRLIRRLLDAGRPVLTGLSATWLYREAREVGLEGTPDDIHGSPSGHFVVLCGYDRRSGEVLVADPLHGSPLSAGSAVYAVAGERVINAILLGVLTYDGNLLVLEPGTRCEARVPAEAIR